MDRRAAPLTAEEVPRSATSWQRSQSTKIRRPAPPLGTAALFSQILGRGEEAAEVDFCNISRPPPWAWAP